MKIIIIIIIIIIHIYLTCHKVRRYRDMSTSGKIIIIIIIIIIHIYLTCHKVRRYRDMSTSGQFYDLPKIWKKLPVCRTRKNRTAEILDHTEISHATIIRNCDHEMLTHNWKQTITNQAIKYTTKAEGSSNLD